MDNAHIFEGQLNEILEGHTNYLRNNVRKIFDKYKNNWSPETKNGFIYFTRQILKFAMNSEHIPNDWNISPALGEVAGVCNNNVINNVRGTQADKTKDAILMTKAMEGPKKIYRKEIIYDTLRESLGLTEEQESFQVTEETYIKSIGNAIGTNINNKMCYLKTLASSTQEHWTDLVLHQPWAADLVKKINETKGFFQGGGGNRITHSMPDYHVSIQYQDPVTSKEFMIQQHIEKHGFQKEKANFQDRENNTQIKTQSSSHCQTF